MTLPTLFISHGGGPWPWMDFGPENPFEGLDRYLKALPRALGPKPKAILMVSGHWEEREFTLMTSPRPPMLYDYYGFPEETYRIQYAAPGAPELAGRVRGLLKEAGIASGEDGKRGFDHGTFVPLAVMYPEADVPVLQLSMKRGYDVGAHFAAGRALAPLRDEGVLIVGSGLSYHNLRLFGPEGGPASKAFDAWLTQATLTRDPAERQAKLARWAEAPSARVAHPREDHLVPLFVAAGAALGDVAEKTYSDRVLGLEVSGFQFGPSTR